MSLSEKERKALEIEIRKELEEEHLARENRAERKAEQRSERSSRQPISKEKSIQRLRSEIRREFYLENDYKPVDDPTGRKMWLSPTEQRNKERRKRPRKRRLRRFSYRHTRFILYFAVSMAAVVVGLILVG